MDGQNTTFDPTFTAAGVYPFSCVYHAGFNMRGVVDVRPTAGVTRFRGVPERPGFVLGPSPNPTRAGATFRFALREAGHAKVEVFDVWGRLVALPLSRDLEPGVYAASWDGRTQTGFAAAPGNYYLRLGVPGVMQSRRVTVIR